MSNSNVGVRHQYQLCTQLGTFKQQKGESLTDFLFRMQCIWAQSASFEPKFSSRADATKFVQYQESAKAMQFLMGLHEDYHPARDSLLHSDNLPKLKDIPTELTRLYTIPKRIHPSHPEHPLEKKTLKSTYECFVCKMQGFGPRYRCDKCDVDMHEECMSPSPMVTFQGHECRHFESLPLCLCESKNCKVRRWCDACGKAIEGFLYHCEKNGMSFHPMCVKLKSRVTRRGVEFRLQGDGPSRECKFCGKKRLQGTHKKRGWSYVSKSGCDYHVKCFMELQTQQQEK